MKLLVPKSSTELVSFFEMLVTKEGSYATPAGPALES